MDKVFDFSGLEKLLLPWGSHFSEDARAVINCWESRDILACPGSGKTTVLLAKLKIIADQLPLPDGKGVCVLSHTNVAINELKNKFGSVAFKLSSSPNFIGTIQTFIDRFVLFPFLRNSVSCSLCLLNDEDYAKNLYYTINAKFPETSKFLRSKFHYCNRRYNSLYEYIMTLDLDDEGNLVQINSSKTIISQKDKQHAKNYNEAIKILLINKGILRYKDTYRISTKMLQKYGNILGSILSERFSYVFIDEYQDCSKVQCQIFDALFSNTDTVFQRIGDPDQAIYNNEDGENTENWNHCDKILFISHTNRFGQEIADVLSFFKCGGEKICSSLGFRKIKPTLLVYEASSQENVIPTFIKLIIDNNLVIKNGIYKDIGMYENVSGLKISDYYPHYKSKSIINNNNSYNYYISEFYDALISGNIFRIKKSIINLLKRIFHFLDVWDNDSSRTTHLNTFLKDKISSNMKDFIFNLSSLKLISYSTITQKVNAFIYSIVGIDKFNKIPSYFKDNNLQRESLLNEICINKYIDAKVIVDTVYGVKGETHDATLYLETEYKKSSDILRAIKLISSYRTNKRVEDKNGMYNKSLKCVYVGLSRPKHLLCLAIRKSTYKKYEQFFCGWEIENL